jgi:allantoin racemase
MRLLLVNPNTNATTTEAMARIARAAAPEGVRIATLTAPFGAALLTTPEDIAEAAHAVEALFADHPPQGVDGVILAAFADPALDALREHLPLPVTGIAEAGMAEAARGGRRFAVVTTTPDLVGSIAGLAARYGHGKAFLGTALTEGDAATITNDPNLLPEALRLACSRAVSELGAEAIVIGGGPLAVAARAIASDIAVPLIEPVPAAVRLAIMRAMETA